MARLIKPGHDGVWLIVYVKKIHCRKIKSFDASFTIYAFWSVEPQYSCRSILLQKSVVSIRVTCVSFCPFSGVRRVTGCQVDMDSLTHSHSQSKMTQKMKSNHHNWPSSELS